LPVGRAIVGRERDIERSTAVGAVVARNRHHGALPRTVIAQILPQRTMPGRIGVRLLTLDDTVEFFNLVLELKLSETEKKDLVAFMRVL